MSIDRKELAKQMGQEIQALRHKLQKYTTDSQYQKITTKAETTHLSKALGQIDSYISKTEDRCFSKGYIDSVNTFYGLDVRGIK